MQLSAYTFNFGISVQQLKVVYDEFISNLQEISEIKEFLFIFLHYINNPVTREHFENYFANANFSTFQYFQLTCFMKEFVLPTSKCIIIIRVLFNTNS